MIASSDVASASTWLEAEAERQRRHEQRAAADAEQPGDDAGRRSR